jgi:hypothetical protein
VTIVVDAVAFQSVTASARTTLGDASETSTGTMSSEIIGIFLK